MFFLVRRHMTFKLTGTFSLRSAAIYPQPATRTKRFTSSVQYFLLSYQ